MSVKNTLWQNCDEKHVIAVKRPDKFPPLAVYHFVYWLKSYFYDC